MLYKNRQDFRVDTPALRCCLSVLRHPSKIWLVLSFFLWHQQQQQQQSKVATQVLFPLLDLQRKAGGTNSVFVLSTAALHCSNLKVMRFPPIETKFKKIHLFLTALLSICTWFFEIFISRNYLNLIFEIDILPNVWCIKNCTKYSSKNITEVARIFNASYVISNLPV